MLVKVSGGDYFIGTNGNDGYVSDYEKPVTKITVNSFYVSTTVVTNQQFQNFVQNTNYISDSEKFGWSYVFEGFLSDSEKLNSESVDGLEWWYAVNGADWKHPYGPSSNIKDLMDHPVVQVSRNDAIAYCDWVDGRLPSEAEWEIAAKGGTNNTLWPWGDEKMVKDGIYQCNTWTGKFPTFNDAKDGYIGTAPVESYDSNGYGLYQMIGNVWEWCSNPRSIPLSDFRYHTGQEFWLNNKEANNESYAMRGGSFLCHNSYCNRYRISARNGNTGMSAASNIGFRVFSDSHKITNDYQ